MHAALLEAVRGGSVPVGNAAQVIELGQRLERVADPAELHDALERLAGQAGTLRPEELARACRGHADQLRPPRDLDELDEARRAARGLWFSRPNPTGMVNLKGVLDPEHAAIVKGAVDPLAAPRPLLDEAGGMIEPDPRPAHQRRADALVEIIGRGVAAPEGQQTTDKAKVVVTIDYDTLAGRLTPTPDHHRPRRPRRPRTDHADRTEGAEGGAEPGARASAPGSGSRSGSRSGSGSGSGATGRGPAGRDGSDGAGAGFGAGLGAGFGVSATGDVLSPATVRRLACDASLIAAVLGGHGEPLDVGRRHRLVTPAIRTALILRDRGCSFPGCTVPAAWTDAHHLTHWIDGGRTSLDNLALLCRRHHTYVHRHHLTATITATGVTWHTWQHWRHDRPGRGQHRATQPPSTIRDDDADDPGPDPAHPPAGSRTGPRAGPHDRDTAPADPDGGP